MEYAKDETWTSKVFEKIKAHKLITTVVVALLLFSTINIIMIYNFMSILQNI